MGKYKRNTYIIKKGLQFRYMTTIIFTMLIMSSVVGWTIYFSIWSPIASAELVDISDISIIFDKVNDRLLFRIPILIIIIAMISIIISHKIAGPVYRFEQSAKKIAEGDLTLRIHLRKGDEMKSLAILFNDMTEKLENMVKKDRKIVESIVKVIQEIPSDITEENLTEEQKNTIMEELTVLLDDLKDVTHDFNISEEKEEEVENIA